MAAGFADLNRKLDQMARDIGGQNRKVDLNEMGKLLEPEVRRAVEAAIGDDSMSNWRRGAPILIVGAHQVIGDTVAIDPSPRSRGPMRVLESGRKAYAKGDTRISGTRIRKKDGAVVAKRRRVKRNIGATAGKGVWTDATERIAARAPEVANEVRVVRTMDRLFTRGG